MGEVISIHSFRGGTGKSNITANIATQAAMRGHRVAIVDTDINSPGIHVLFGFDETRIQKSLNDYLWGKATIEEAAYPLNTVAGNDPGREFLKDLDLWLIPASIRTGEIARILREGYDVGLLNDGFHTLLAELALDYLFIDTHPGLNEETLLSIAISNAMIIILRPDQQDFQGTAVTVDIARKLEVPHLRLVINKALTRYDFAKMREEIEATYNVPVAGILPLSEDVASNASSNIFSAARPDHPWSQALKHIVDELLSEL